jgi:hypothetical protein
MVAHAEQSGILSEDTVAQASRRLREVGCAEPCLAALYAFGLEGTGEGNLAALFSAGADRSALLDLELSVGKALGMAGVELLDLRRMPLVSRYRVISQGQPLYVGQPDVLAEFIEHTIARYAAFYPLLEALYWKVETSRDSLNTD